MIFQKINNFIKNNWLKAMMQKSLGSSAGQVALVLIVVIAMALIFYAVTLNLGKNSHNKTLTTVASNLGAAQIGSQMASYGHSLFMTQLGGKKKVCGLTGILGSILGIILAIIAIILTPATAGASLTLAIIGLSLSVISLGVQLVVIQPGLTSAWNKIQAESGLSLKDQFLENGISTALQNAVDDPVLVPDYNDQDTDGLWGFNTNGTPKDQISRFGYYYTLRLNSIDVSSIPAIVNFQSGLTDFLYFSSSTDAWALHDPAKSDCPNPNNPCCFNINNPNNQLAECNPCCVPNNLLDPNYPGYGPIQTYSAVPECCTATGAAKCGDVGSCQNNSPYASGSAVGHTYKFVYDRYYENIWNSQQSFREKLGRDDESMDYFKNPSNPNSDPLINNLLHQAVQPALTQKFRHDDTTGFYNYKLLGGLPLPIPVGGMTATEPYSAGSPPPVAPRYGVYGFFYKLSDWGFDLQQALSPPVGPPPANNVNNPECNWCDKYYTSPGGTHVCSNPYVPIGVLKQLPDWNSQLGSIPFPAGASFYSPSWQPTIANLSHCVDSPLSAPPITQVPPNTSVTLAVDKVTVPPNIILKPTDPAYNSTCAQKLMDPINVGTVLNANGFWKKGADRYCSNGDSTNPNLIQWPYFSRCTKHGTCQEPDDEGGFIPVDCECGETGSQVTTAPLPGGSWPDDVIDDLVYGTADFIEWAEDNILSKSLAELKDSFQDWYEEAAKWIEPGGSIANPGTNCFICPANNGGLRVWRDEIHEIRVRLDDFGFNTTNNPNTLYQGSSCSDVWCVPPPQPGTANEYGLADCPGVSPLEKAIYSPKQGTLADVRACLDHYVNGGSVTVGANTYTYPSAWQRFKNCGENCTYNDCAFLPRSLVPGWENKPLGANFPPAVSPADEGDLSKFIACIVDCRNTTCKAMPALRANGTPYFPVVDPLNPYYPNIVPSAVNFEVPGLCDTTYHTPSAALYNYLAAPPGTPGVLFGGAIWSVNPACTDQNWFIGVRKSANEAYLQNIKLSHRLDFINELSFAGADLNLTLASAETEINNFLTNFADPLIQARINYTDDNAPLPYQAIYAWQSSLKDQLNMQPTDPWHIVRVDARLTGRCDNSCNTQQLAGGGDPGFPQVQSKTKNWGTTRCYFLANTDGVIKVRVTRYDQTRSSLGLYFPNGAPIWTFGFGHPDRPIVDNGNDLGATCVNQLITPPGMTQPYNQLYQRAFIMNKYIAGTNDLCWARVTKLLSQGISSETCAKYYYHEGARKGFSFDFIECKDF